MEMTKRSLKYKDISTRYLKICICEISWRGSIQIWYWLGVRIGPWFIDSYVIEALWNQMRVSG